MMKYNAVLFDYGGTLSGKGSASGSHAFSESESWVTKMLRELFESGYRIGIVSNSNRYGDARWLREKVCKNGWSGYIECIFGSGGMFSRQDQADLGCHKPDPRIYERALHCLGLSDYPRRVLFVGDDLKADVVGPRLVGMDGMLVDNSEDYSRELWGVLGDSPTTKRFNVLTEYLIDYKSAGPGVPKSPALAKCGVTEVTTHLKHLTEPLELNQEIVVGLETFRVVSWDLDHTKADILDTTKNHRQLITISVVYA